MDLQAVLWDFGGVLTSSPFDAFNRYEAEHGLPKDFIRSINAVNGDSNAWARFERSEIDAEGFDKAFAREARAKGHNVPGKTVLSLLSGDLRPRIIAALKICKIHVKTGCITNNVKSGKGAGMSFDAAKAEAVANVMALFDHVIESSKIGLRKPDPQIYAQMCKTLEIDPKACIYIDDLGINLKPARAMGMTTIKALDEQQILDDLAAATGFTFA